MHVSIALQRDALSALCRRFDIARLDIFGSAARATDFDPARSDADFLVKFKSDADEFSRFADFQDALGALLGRPVDLVERGAIEASRNYIRRRRILEEAQEIHAA